MASSRCQSELRQSGVRPTDHGLENRVDVAKDGMLASRSPRGTDREGMLRRSFDAIGQFERPRSIAASITCVSVSAPDAKAREGIRG